LSENRDKHSDDDKGNGNQTLGQQAIEATNRFRRLWDPNWKPFQAGYPYSEPTVDDMPSKIAAYEDLLDCCQEATSNINKLRSGIDRFWIDFEWADRLFERSRTCSEFWQRARRGRRRSA